MVPGDSNLAGPLLITFQLSQRVATGVCRKEAFCVLCSQLAWVHVVLIHFYA